MKPILSRLSGTALLGLFAALLSAQACGQTARLKLEVVNTVAEPIIGKKTPGAEKIPGGFEGGNSVKVVIDGKAQYHFFSHSYPGLGWHRSQLDHWVSDDGRQFRHAGVLQEDFEDKAAGERHIFTAPIPFYVDQENRWYLSYGEFVGKTGSNWTPGTGRMWCAPSSLSGLAGINGPFEFAKRYEFVPTQFLNKRPVSNGNPFQVKDGRWAVMICPDGLVSKTSGHWPILLGFAPSALGPYQSPAEHLVAPMIHPTGYTENPMVVKVKGPKSGRDYWVAVFDFLGPEGGIYKPFNVFGFTWSDDGLNWPSEHGQAVNVDDGLPAGQQGWWRGQDAVRTPHQMLDEGDGTYTVFFTGKGDQGFRPMGKVTVRLVEE